MRAADWTYILLHWALLVALTTLLGTYIAKF